MVPPWMALNLERGTATLLVLVATLLGPSMVGRKEEPHSKIISPPGNVSFVLQGSDRIALFISNNTDPANKRIIKYHARREIKRNNVPGDLTETIQVEKVKNG